ncbi:MAG: tripartite tricarboxylate transporter substrate binding protein [Syntrophales bacterium]|nr:tripartite tricarboxylate transporter substrate binding protein [Syntrophales bacterium]
MKKRFVLAIFLGVILSWFGLQNAYAQQEKPFPTRQINYMICFDPGGQSDRVARLQQPLLEKALKQKVIVDYKIGGGGALGWRELSRAKPDGYTVAGFNIPHIILQPLQQEVGYKTEQIVPVVIFQKTPLALAVLKTSPHKTFREFIDYAKKNPGKVTIGGSGTFSGYHMTVLRLEKMTGAKFTYVPFTGSAPQVTAFLGGHVDAIAGASDDLTMHKDKMRVFAFATDKRFSGFPDVPTFKELKINLVEAVDRGVAVPPKTPAYIIKKLEAAYLEVAKAPSIQAEMKRQGFIPVAIGHEESKAYVAKMTAIYKGLTAGLKK